jgi:hypothetical protein
MAAFESELAPRLENIIATQALSNEEDRVYLMNLIANVAIRNPGHREVYRDFHERLSKGIMSLATSTREVWESQVRQATAAGYLGPDSDTDYERMKDFVQRGEYDIEVPNEMHLTAEMEGLDAILPCLFHRKWVLVKAPTGSAGFVTSDRPACLIWSEKRRGPIGFGLKGTEVIFPISNRLVVMGAFEIDDGEMTATDEQVAKLNGLFILHSDRQVYSRDYNFIYSPRQGSPARKASKLITDEIFVAS